MKPATILLQNPQAAVHGLIPSVPHSRRAVEENYPIASIKLDGPKNPAPARQTYDPDLNDAPDALQPHTTFVRPLYGPHTAFVRVAYGSCTAFQPPKKGLIRVNKGKYDPTTKKRPFGRMNQRYYERNQPGRNCEISPVHPSRALAGKTEPVEAL